MSSLVRWLYSAALLVLLPALLLHVLLRSRKEPAYRQRLGERLGFVKTLSHYRGATWLHAVSLGEMRTAQLLIQQWRLQEPAARFILTCTTATGWEQAQHIAQQHPQHIHTTWLPWDFAFAMQRFMRVYAPSKILLIETEVWPNMVHSAHKKTIPMYLINARLSAKSLQKAWRIRALARPAFSQLTGVIAQSPDDAQRLTQLGASILGISGNIKFDAQSHTAQINQAENLLAQWHKPYIILLASSREGEEQLFLQALAQLGPAQRKSFIPLIVPRHLQRVADIADLARQHGWSPLTRANWPQTAPRGPTLLLGDTLGEMGFYYSLAQIALMGGSFAPFGGQNLIEALAHHCPVILGPYTYNFAQAAENALHYKLAQTADTMQQALQMALPQNTFNPPAADFEHFLQQNRGAIQKTLQILAASCKN